MFIRYKKWLLLSTVILLFVGFFTSIYYIQKQDDIYDTAWYISSKDSDGEIIYDTYFFTRKTIYRVIGSGQEQSFIVYSILRQEGYDYRVVVMKSLVNEKHSEIAPSYGHGTLTVVSAKSDKLFIGHKINNRSIRQYYSGFYRK